MNEYIPIIHDIATHAKLVSSDEDEEGDTLWIGTYKEWREYERLENKYLKQ